MTNEGRLRVMVFAICNIYYINNYHTIAPMQYFTYDGYSYRI